jgi:hypothetical protein
MGKTHPSLPRHHEQNGKHPPLRREVNEKDVHALMEENAELRKLVIQSSKLVIRNVMDH